MVFITLSNLLDGIVSSSILASNQAFCRLRSFDSYVYMPSHFCWEQMFSLNTRSVFFCFTSPAENNFSVQIFCKYDYANNIMTTYRVQKLTGPTTQPELDYILRPSTFVVDGEGKCVFAHFYSWHPLKIVLDTYNLNKSFRGRWLSGHCTLVREVPESDHPISQQVSTWRGLGLEPRVMQVAHYRFSGCN